MCCGDAHVPTWVPMLDFELLSHVQWCGHVLSRCGVRVMGTVLDFEQQSQNPMVYPCVVDM